MNISVHSNLVASHNIKENKLCFTRWIKFLKIFVYNEKSLKNGTFMSKAIIHNWYCLKNWVLILEREYIRTNKLIVVYKFFEVV